jgi:hypothetical protein
MPGKSLPQSAAAAAAAASEIQLSKTNGIAGNSLVQAAVSRIQQPGSVQN